MHRRLIFGGIIAALSMATAAGAIADVGSAESAHILSLVDGTATIRPTTATHYDLALTDFGNTTLGVFWYADFAGLNFLGLPPTALESPAGWTATVTHSPGSTDGFGIQWVANSPDSYLQAGNTLSGFGFETSDTIDHVTGPSVFYPAFQVGTAVVYQSGAVDNEGAEIEVTTVPEPGAATLFIFMAAGVLAKRQCPPGGCIRLFIAPTT